MRTESGLLYAQKFESLPVQRSLEKAKCMLWKQRYGLEPVREVCQGAGATDGRAVLLVGKQGIILWGKLSTEENLDLREMKNLKGKGKV